MAKRLISVRLSDKTLKCISFISDSLGIDRTKVIECAISDFYYDVKCDVASFKCVV